MIKQHTETQSKEVVVLDDILCNQCGESLKDDEGMNFEGLVTNVCGGYASKLGDGSNYTFAICEDCLKVLFAGFKLPPTRGGGWDDHNHADIANESEAGQ